MVFYNNDTYYRPIVQPMENIGGYVKKTATEYPQKTDRYQAKTWASYQL